MHSPPCQPEILNSTGTPTIPPSHDHASARSAALSSLRPCYRRSTLDLPAANKRPPCSTRIDRLRFLLHAVIFPHIFRSRHTVMPHFHLDLDLPSIDPSSSIFLQPLTFVPKFQYPRRIRRSIFVYIRNKGRTLAILFPRDPRFSSAKTSHGPAFQRHARPNGTDGRGDEKMWDGKLVGVDVSTAGYIAYRKTRADGSAFRRGGATRGRLTRS